MALVRSVFGHAIDTAPVRIRRRKWFPFQPVHVTMAPMGHLHFHPRGESYCDDFAQADLALQGHFIHEMTHVWQAQTRGKLWVVVRGAIDRRYDYALQPGRSLARYGLEQQAEIVRHAFLLRSGATTTGFANAGDYDSLVNFPGASG